MEAPLYNLQDVPANGRAYFASAHGTKVRFAIWDGGDKGTVLLFPGRTEYIEKYGRVVSKLMERGLNVVVFDWRGQGLSDRPDDRTDRGYVEKFSDYQNDITAILATPEVTALTGPRFLFTHSMGGAIGLRALINGLDVKAAVFSAPMWGLEGPTIAWHVLGAINTLGRPFGMHKNLAPGTKPTFYVQASEFEGNELTNDADHYTYFRGQLDSNPELGLGGPTIHWAVTAVQELDAIKIAPAPKTPMLVLLGSQEAVVSSAAIKNLVPKLPNARLEMVEGAKHEVWMETPEIRDNVWELIDQFIADA